ncbi:hypothetical protein BU23DRAFT_589727 [Bimuria novae-zelandiae CBS 107.79]|uniref:Uncharacterized protein n=1 Tax=Bimuria novae-zelandiae CBS 107.79 TaxID=1447943 RepID=A0A6A5VAG4_9PLEO|nr:hypothetical protein BU23DRAFT_589727 [Bimuria novae-zelandiae CBS 107.79]
MSKLPISPFWSCNPQIPIYLDTGNEREQICPNCDLNSRDHPIHCITTASPAPPSYRSAASPAISLGNLAPPTYDASASPAASSRNLAMPTLRLETPRPTTIHDDEPGRRSYTSGSSIPNTPVDDTGSTTKGNLGLGIPEAPFNPDPSPIRSPGSERLATAEKGGPVRKSSTPNLAEGLEQKLWKYSASSNVVKRWLLEIISWLLSALCISAIIILLFFLQGKLFPKQWPMNITLNAYIAILSRIASASLMLPVSEALGQLKWSWFQGHSKKMWDFELFDNASIPKIIRYEPHFTKQTKDGAEEMNPDLNINAICPTSDCDWEPYETFGVCSDCADVADMLDFGCLDANLDWVQNATQFIPYESGTMCGWFFNATSERPMLMLGYQVDSPSNRSTGEVLTTRTLPLVTNATLECVLSWCVKTIESSYHEATYSEVVKDRFINTTAGPFPWTFIASDANNPNDTAGKMQYLQSITVDPRARNGQGNVSSYGASNETAMSILAIFDDYLPSFATLSNNKSKPLLKYKFWDEEPYEREFPINPWSTPNNVAHHVGRLATVMTNFMRQSSDDAVLGKAFSQETYVEVRWVWLTLPLVLLGLTLIFLLGTVIRTSMECDRVGVWKNSAIATLLYGLPDEMQQKISTSHGQGTPRAKAKEMNVRMLSTKKWRVSGHILSPTVRKPKPPPGWI